jgi:hypothetical protein
MLNPKRHQVDRLRDAIGDTLSEIEKLAPERPSVQAVLAASLLIEKAIGIDLQIAVRKQPNGLFLGRKSRSDYLHALTVEGDLYVDYRMYHADTFDDRYDDFVSAVLGFAEPFKADIERLTKP